MKVRCVDNWNYENLIKVGEVYDVLEWSYGYQIKPGITISKNKFEIVMEDKVEEIKGVKKLEDLDGLENGMGLYIEWKERKNRIEIKKEDNVINWFCLSDVCNLGLIYILDVIKAMGFKFEYKPLRSLEEVLEEMKENSLDIYKKHNFEVFEVEYGKEYGKNRYCYEVCNTYGCYTLGGYIFDEKTAQKYADELNEIIGGK